MRLILNADDFGRSPEINRAVERAHIEGVLDSASLMVAGAAAADAVEIARRHPSLSLGLHLVVVAGPSVLGGQLPNRPLSLGLRYVMSKSARRALAAEMAAQFERFAATGLPLAHVDGHQHMHMHPIVFDLLVPLAEKYRARRIRIVHDDLWLALAHDRHGLLGKSILAAIFAALSWRCRRYCRGRNIASLERTYGFFQSGAMDQPYVLSVLRRVKTSAEIYFHPTEGPRLDALGPNPIDFQTLLDPQVRKAVEELQPIEPRLAASLLLSDGATLVDAGSWTRA